MAKINHDLRNMLSSAQLVAERLGHSGDPRVSLALPRLERALDRAVRLAGNVLAYGRSEEPAPQAVLLRLGGCVQAAAEDAGLSEEAVALRTDVSGDFNVSADPDQLHRILVNLLRNAREAIEAVGRKGQVSLSARHVRESGGGGGASLIEIRDNGPGLPDRVRERLFQPFSSSGRPGGAGLGLAIARELARGHGGDLTLTHSGPEGAVFELRLPDPG